MPVVGSAAPAKGPAQKAGFVYRSGTKLYLDGNPYRFVGMNIYNANSRWNCWYPLGYGDGDLDASLAAMTDKTAGSQANAFRAWFVQPLATTNGLRDWSAFDHTLAVAKTRGVKVVATLGDEWGACDSPYVYHNETWYKTGYYTAHADGMPSTYEKWVQEVVARYKNNPTILAWQLMNEAEDLDANWNCSPTAASTLQAFTKRMGSDVKKLDGNHLLSLGTIGSGQCGANGPEYLALHTISTIDLCEYHDYAHPFEPMPGDQWHGLAVMIQQCGSLNKPLFVGESGITTAEAGSADGRAALFAAKFQAQFSAGVVGELVWDWCEAQYGGSSSGSYEVGPGDPTIAQLRFPSA